MDHPGQLCRLCAVPCTFAEICYLFNDDEQVIKLGEGDDDEFSGLDLVELINMSLPIKVTQQDILPKQVCFQCIEKLKASCEFAAGCLAAEQELQRLCDNNKFKSETIDSKKDKNLKPMLTDRELEAALKETNIVEMEDPDPETPANADYCCPLCCDGQMTRNIDSPAEEPGDEKDDDVIEDPSDSEISLEDILMSSVDSKLSEVDDFMMKDLEEDLDLEEKKGEETKPDCLDGQAERNLNDSREKKRKVFGGRGRGRARKRGRPRGSASVSRRVADDDTLMWVGEDTQHSVPLVQCVRCSGWLPGFAACLQHTLSSHVNDDEDNKAVECSRCEMQPFKSEKELIEHFTKKHCADLVVRLTEDGTYSIADKKGTTDGRRFRKVAYHCSICEKGFSWLLNFLRHSCLPFDSDNMICEVCDKSFIKRQRFVFHKQFHAPNPPALECDVCGEIFDSDTSLYDHARFAHLDENIVCDECGKHFRSEKGLHSHRQSAHNLDPESSTRHKCPECGKGFRDRQGLREHSATHMSLKPFPCDKCDRAYNRYSRLKQHQLTHVYEDSMECFECDTCGSAFPTEESALEHSQFDGHVVQTVTLTKVYRCEFCDSLFSRADSLNQHRPIHDGVEKPYACHICNAAFSSYSRVTTHKSTHGLYDQIEPQENDFSIPKHFLCEHCGSSYLYWSYLRTHRKTHSDNPYVVSCKFCPEKFKNSWSAVYHRKKVHDGGGTVREWRRKALSCSICGNNYMYQHTLDMHMEKKHGPYTDGVRENYQCEACGKVFKYQSSLVLHQKMHLGQKSFHCEDCNKGFLTVATWRNHVKRCHEGVRPHKCDFCDKTFFHKGAKDDHVRVHTGEKPFECQYCNKKFRLKTMLTDHVKIHIDDRPYPCDICGTSFRRMVHMKQHRMLHTGERPYECPMCHLDFRLKQELQRHLKSKHAAPELPEEKEEFMFSE